jgi:hypothetical protein
MKLSTIVKVQRVHNLELTHEEMQWLIAICGNISGGGKIRDFTDKIYNSHLEAGFTLDDIDVDNFIKDGVIQVKEI